MKTDDEIYAAAEKIRQACEIEQNYKLHLAKWRHEVNRRKRPKPGAGAVPADAPRPKAPAGGAES